MLPPPVSGGPVLSRVMLIGQAPGVKEPVLGKPFAWTAGRTLFGWFQQFCEMSELEVRGPWVAASYYNAPEAADRFTEDGWFRTGDVVTLDQRGFPVVGSSVDIGAFQGELLVVESTGGDVNINAAQLTLPGAIRLLATREKDTCDSEHSGEAMGSSPA